MSDLLTVAEVKERVTTGLPDAALELLIDAQDSYIRRMVGEHDPATTMVYEDQQNPGRRVWLPRPASSIALVEDRYLADSAWTVRAPSTYYLSDQGRSVEVSWGQWFRTRVRITFTPVPQNDERIQALVALVRLETQDTGLESERDDTYAYQAKDKAKARMEIVAALKPRYRMLA